MQTRKRLLKLELRLLLSAGKSCVRAQGLDNAVNWYMMNPPCRTLAQRRESDTVYTGLTRCAERAGGSQITQLQPAGQIDIISQHEKEDVQDGQTHASKTHEQPVCSAHTRLCHDHAG